MAEISQSAQDKLRFIKDTAMKDAFELPEAREALLADSERASHEAFVLPEGVAADERVEVKELRADDGTQCFLLTPKDCDAERRLVVYYHGGGFVMQIGDLHWEPCIRLAVEAAAPVLVPIYPLLPVAHYVQAYASALAAYRLALELAPAGRIALAGDSAGGHLACGVAQVAVAEGMPTPGVVIGISPMADVASEVAVPAELDELDPMLGINGTRVIARLWGEKAAEEPAFPPCLLHGPLLGLPPLHIYMGSREVLRPGVEAYVQAVQAAGGDVHFTVGEGLWHCYAIMLDMDEGCQAFAEIVGLVRNL